MHDHDWNEIERELKRPARTDPAAVDRVMGRLRASSPTPRRSGFWHWLTRPRPVAVSPLGGLLATAGFAALLALSWSGQGGGPAWREGTPLASSPSPVGLDTGAPHHEAVQQIQFVLVSTDASRVSLVGDFNNWDPEATPLRKTEDAGVWSAILPLHSGRYLYAFVVDGTQWVTDDTAPRGPESSFGSNSVILVGDGL